MRPSRISFDNPALKHNQPQLAPPTDSLFHRTWQSITSALGTLYQRCSLDWLWTSFSRRLQKRARQEARTRARGSRRLRVIESLEGRSLMAFGVGEIAFSGFQGTSGTDKVSLVLLGGATNGDVLTITDNAWTGSALSTSEGLSTLTFQNSFAPGTQLNYDSTRATGQKWAVGTTPTGLSDVTASNFNLSASGESLLAFNGSAAPTSNTDVNWVAAFSTNPFLTTGGTSANTTYLPTALSSPTLSLSLGLTGSNQNGAYTGGSLSGSALQVRTALHLATNWTSFTTAGGQAIPPGATFTIQSGGTNSSPNGITLSRSEVLENAPANSLVGTFTTSDPDVGNTFSYALVSGVGSTDNASFNIAGNALRTNSPFDFETKSSYAIRVRTTDQGGLSHEQSMTISVTNLNEILDVKLNEIKAVPPGTTTAGNKFQYVELRGTPGASLNNVYLVMVDGNQASLGTARYVFNLSGRSLGSNGLLLLKSPTGGHNASAGTNVVTDTAFDDPNGILSKQSVTFYLATATSPFVQGTDYDSNNDGMLDTLPTGFALNDHVGWSDGDSGDRVYGSVAILQTQGSPDAATRFVNNTDIDFGAWFNGDLVQTGTDPAQLAYDATRASANLPTTPSVARLTPGDANFEEPSSNSNLRIVSYNITGSSGAGAPRTGLATILEAIGSEVVSGVSRPIDLLAMQEVAAQNSTSAAVANLLNALYGTSIYAYGSLDGDSTGAGTQGVVYNTQTLRLIGETAIGTASGTGQPRQTIRHHFETVADATSEFYFYNSHWKSADDTDGRNRRRLEADAIRADADALGNGSHVIYVGDFNLYDSSETAYQKMLSAGNGQAFDPINRPGNWHGTSSFRDIFTQAPAVSPGGGLTGGGLDDRFDFQLITGEFIDGVGLEYRPGTYHVFGNNGSVALNGNINDSSSTALSGFANRTTILNLLTTVSDHLPVVADYFFPSGPSTPLPPDLTLATDLGASNSDHLTSETRPEFSGVATPGNQVAIYANDVLLVQGVVGPSGTYSLRPANPMPAGTYQIKAKQIDGSNQSSDLSAAMFPSLRIDTAAPNGTLASLLPTVRTTSLDSLQVVFNEPVANLQLNRLSLSRQGGPNLLTPAQTVTTTDGGLTWTIGNLAPVNTLTGEYVLALTPTGVIDLAGNSLSSTPTSGGSFSRPFQLVLHPPTDLTLQVQSVPETNAVNSNAVLFGSFTTTDADLLDQFQYQLVSGDGSSDNAKFQLVGSQLFLLPGELLDFETKPSYQVRVQVSDLANQLYQEAFVVSLTDVNEAPTGLSLSQSVLTLPESTSTATSIKLADIVVQDDALGSNTLSLAGIDAGHFEIVGSALFLRSGVSLDFETQNQYTIAIRVDDPTVGNSPDAWVNYTLSISDVVESTPPVITAFDTTVVFRENALPLLLDSNASVLDVDSIDFDGGRLTVSLTANSHESDELRIRHVGNGPNQIGRTGNLVTFSGLPIGTVAGGTLGQPLTIDFQGNVNAVKVSAVLRSLQFVNPSNNPTDLLRTVQVILTDGDGGTSLPATKLVQVIPSNDIPVLSQFSGAVSFTEDGSAVLLAPNSLVQDIDSSSFDLGTISVRVAMNSHATDRLTVRHQGTAAGEIGVLGNEVLYGGVTVGTWMGTTSLVVSLNSQATPAIAEAILRNIQFSNISGAPSQLPRQITATVNDGDRGTSLRSTMTVNVSAVNDAPSITGFDLPITYREGAAPLLLDTNSVLIDVDLLDFELGVMTVTLSQSEPTDRLSIRHQGTGMGQVGLVANDLFFEGVMIGTVGGGRVDSSPLVIAWNANARQKGIQAVLRNLVFWNESQAPSNQARSVAISLSDGDGGNSALVSKTIQVTPVNDAPAIQNFDGFTVFGSTSSPLLIDNDASLVDEDTSTFNGGKLTVQLSVNTQSTDRLTIHSVGDGADQVRVSGAQVFYQGVEVGSWTGTTRLIVTFNANANQAAVQKILRSIAFSSLSSNPSMLARTVRASLTDGAGGTSLTVSKQIVWPV